MKRGDEGMERTILKFVERGYPIVPTSTIRIESEDGENDSTEGSTRLCSPKWKVFVRAIKQCKFGGENYEKIINDLYSNSMCVYDVDCGGTRHSERADN